MLGSAEGGITLQIKKKAEAAGELKAYIYLIMDAQLNIQNGAFISAVYYENGEVTHDGTPYKIQNYVYYENGEVTHDGIPYKIFKIIVHGSNWGWKDTSGLRLTQNRIP